MDFARMVICLLYFTKPDFVYSGNTIGSRQSYTNSSSTGDPEFTQPIGNLTTPVGREAVLSCVVDNLGKHRVGWLRAEDQTVLSLHTSLVTHNPRISLTHDRQQGLWQLHIRQVKPSDGGCYMCQVNTRVMKKLVGCIDVHVSPDIVYEETSGDVAVLEGDNATLVCQATGHPRPRLMWKREDGAPILLRRSLREATPVVYYHSRTQPFPIPLAVFLGTYLCIASNDIPPAVSKRITLHVNFAPAITVPNQLLGAPLGTDVLLECHVEAFPATITYWLRNRSDMLLSGGQKFWMNEKKIEYKVVMRMIIHDFEESDIGTYNCVATNSLGRSEGTLRLYGLAENTNRIDRLPEESSTSSSSSSSAISDVTISILALAVGFLVIR
ncbi:hypothetical protein LSTR_LSTR011237 [Laodelphax striatellus]|uniref:Ig-like domain-containing protein n=1 Tax=Laodelphax striatellus TaxID=195883 RepID=A0A482XS08_LAOST|nr:hypothetical protein LSTR_LSTR011237 [Laodelphax striatellus]